MAPATKKSSTTKTPSKKAGSSRKYSPAASASVEREMKAMKQGKLRSGTGAKVTNPKQAIAIGLSEARREGDEAPTPPAGSAAAKKSRSGSGAKKAATKKAAAKKTAAKKTATKKSVAKKTASQKTAAKKS
jgi:hypothetical protein